MALINCPECGRQVSDKAAACPECGYPIAANRPDGDVLIRIGEFIVPGAASYAARARSIQIRDAAGNILGTGRQHSTIRIHLDKPTRVGFYLCIVGSGSCVASILLQPRKRYELICIRKLLSVSYEIHEVDHIDAD